MKAFSKEWWLKKGLGVRPVGLEIGTCFKRSIKQQHTLAMFCFKRYAEAYHREKMKEDAYEERVGKLAGILLVEHGVIKEQERILGIIREVSSKYTTENPFESSARLLRNELIEKIKGE